jgi:hypothetical protein
MYCSQRTEMGWTALQGGWIMNTKGILEGKAYGRRTVGKPTERWTDSVTGDVRGC